MIYQRKRLRPAIAVVLSTAVLVFVVWVAAPKQVGGDTSFGLTSKPFEIEVMSLAERIVFGVGAGLTLVGGLMALARSRHPIVIDDDGVADRAAFPARIRWAAVENVQMIGSEKKGYRVEILSGGRGYFIEIGDVEATPGSVFQDIFETWNKHRRG